MNGQLDDDEFLCFTAMAGVFSGAGSVDALWQRVVHAQVAPLTDMSSRWGIDRDKIFSSVIGERNRVYLDRAYCLSDADDRGSMSPWGRQISITRTVLEQLAGEAERTGIAMERTDTALVLATSWSDESYFMADASGSCRRSGWFDPAAQTRELADALSLGGPALAVDTACSSFAYALDTATA